MWHKAIMRIMDSAKVSPMQREIEVECQSIEILLELVANELLRVYDGSASLHLKGLRGCLHVALELSTWTSSTHCGTPDAVEQRSLLVMRKCATDALCYGNGLLSRSTPTDHNGSCPKS